jgi:hypothetical protein
MRRTLFAFFGLAFALYWMSTADLPHENKETLDPVLPSLVQLPSKVGGFVRRQLAHDSDLRGWLRNIAAQADTATATKELKERAAHLNAHELDHLRDMAIARGMSLKERFLAIYLISLANEPSSLDLLKQIGKSAIPPTVSNRAHSDEIVVRARALEALIKRLPSHESARYLHELLVRTSDPEMARQARYWLSHRG